jgi:hypothetical protein
LRNFIRTFSIDYLTLLPLFQKYKYIRGFLALERSQRHHHFTKSAAEWTSKAIVSLELHSEPIKSVAQATQLEGVRIIYFFTGVGGGTCCKQFCLFWLPRAVDFKVSCS